MRRARVGVGIDRDRLDPHAPRGADHPARDLPAIGDQDFLEHQLASLIRAIERASQRQQIAKPIQKITRLASRILVTDKSASAANHRRAKPKSR